MKQIENYYQKTLHAKTSGALGLDIPDFTKEVAYKLKDRIDNIVLYLHSYTLYKNFYYGKYTIIDLLDLAYSFGLKGIAINIGTGEERSLKHKTSQEISEISNYAKSLNLKINIDISSTNIEEFKTAVYIANILDSKYIRFYIRDSGLVSQIMQKAVQDIKLMSSIAKENNITILLEQHEDLNSNELLEILKLVDEKNCRVLFDYGNMINSNEKPLEALQIMSPHIEHIHVKGVKIIKDKKGFAHLGISEKEDDLPHAKLLFDLLMLGENEAQVKVFNLEEVNDYYAPAYRFEDEDTDPFIPKRTVSITKINDSDKLKKLLMQEKKDAHGQLIFIHSLLSKLRTIANIKINQA
jgi:sugar phosphate isomerase/epimerase